MAVGIVDPSVLAALALLCGPLLVVAPQATLAAVGIGLLLHARWLSVRTLLITMVLFAASAARGQQRIESYRVAHTELRQRLSAPERCFIRAQVISSPTVRSGNVSFIAEVEHGTCERYSLSQGMRVRLYGGPRVLGRGDRVEAIVQIGILRLFRNFDLPDPYPGRARQGVLASGSVLSLDRFERDHGLRRWIDAARAHTRQRIEATFSPLVTGMAKALVLGENDLTETEDSAFKSSGLAHLLAVSGTHLVFAVLSLVLGLRFVLLRLTALSERIDVGRLAAAVGIVLALVYADFAGGSGSAWRAAWMLAAGLGMRVLAREVGVRLAVVVSITVGWLSDPLVVLDLSFMLSLAATYGLLTLGRRLEQVTRPWPRVLRFCALGFGATVASMLPCAPLLAMLSDNLTVLGIVANVFAAPFGETIALPLCLAHTLLAPFPLLEQGVAWVASGALLVVRRLALSTAATSDFGIALPAPSAWQWALLLLSLVAVRTVKHRSSMPPRAWAANVVILSVAILSQAALEWAVRYSARVPGYLRVTALDVGQGDALLVDLPDGSLMLVDGGGFVGSPVDPGVRVLLPVLRARRRTRVDVVVLSHPHPDHFGGLTAVLSEVEVGQLWDTGQGRAEGAGSEYDNLLRLARESDISVTSPAALCGNFQLGGAKFEVLAPCPAFTPGRDANDNSFVFRVNHGGRSVLFTGDAERLEEERLTRSRPELLRADLLKVGHHGSRTSSNAPFLQAVGAKLAIISCGMRNRFGHPHSVALSRLRDSGALTLRIDRLGAVSWTTDGGEPSVRVTSVSSP